ncbi:multiple sugar transport system permease protein [Actinoplanes octamycinicus]|uniref:Multiple sugar transport system permease protein n=1 Tax=Actinoplanes octamycinicus TaxID=135948 RepID=A0A7W7H1K4_9ACTN|nr:carbohydrate ABC transporter permease [Actinoplanes octamycinicus]MBB4742311.1 multiple sugar transport system permease protein [Actinoplanes octamycinicus]GIE59845.1 sn-glycerol-3-phosphate transport system permease protein UgpE [Actinoplanes octamycinicus]
MATDTSTAPSAITPAPEAHHRQPTREPRWQKIGGYVGRIILVVFFAFPIVFMFVSSLKPDDQIFGDLDSVKAFLPVGKISFDNYSTVFDTVPAGRFLVNSILLSALTVVIGLFVNSLAAFALSRLRWRARTVVLAVIIATLVVPFETFALPMVWWVNKLPWLTLRGGVPLWEFGWLDSYRVQIIPFIANAFAIFLFYSYFQSIPKDLDEAARVDGAGWFRIYRSVVMPLSGPAIATVSILTFLPAWNQYLWPLMVVRSENLRPVMVGVSYFFQLKVAWGPMMAYSTLITIPVLVLFLCFQRAFIGSIASSGVKG